MSYVLRAVKELFANNKPSLYNTYPLPFRPQAPHGSPQNEAKPKHAQARKYHLGAEVRHASAGGERATNRLRNRAPTECRRAKRKGEQGWQEAGGVAIEGIAGSPAHPPPWKEAGEKRGERLGRRRSGRPRLVM
eukprot:scaffold234658_cov30-Tisochrysis_lutea.AAC.1